MNQNKWQSNKQDHFIFFSSKNNEIIAQAGFNLLKMYYKIDGPFNLKINEIG